MIGAVAAGAVAVSQTASLVPADSGLAVDMYARAASLVVPADRAISKSAVAPPAPELSALVAEPDPGHDVQALAKGVALAEERARSDAERAAREAAEAALSRQRDDAEDEDEDEDDECLSSGFDGVASHVARAGHHLQQRFGIDDEDVIGVASRPGNPSSDHPRGYALDFMVDESTGDALAAYAEKYSEELGVKYILWQVKDHYDHVHISFDDEPGSRLVC